MVLALPANEPKTAVQLPRAEAYRLVRALELLRVKASDQAEAEAEGPDLAIIALGTRADTAVRAREGDEPVPIVMVKGVRVRRVLAVLPLSPTEPSQRGVWILDGP